MRRRISWSPAAITMKPEQALAAMQTLQQIALFAGASEAQLGLVVTAMSFVTRLAGKVVILEQEISKSLYVLAVGTVVIVRRVKGEKQQLALLKAPDYFGEV